MCVDPSDPDILEPIALCMEEEEDEDDSVYFQTSVCRLLGQGVAQRGVLQGHTAGWGKGVVREGRGGGRVW